jgi:hypothetical protein
MAIGARRREIGLQFLIETGLLALLGLRSRRRAGVGCRGCPRRGIGNSQSGDRRGHSCGGGSRHAHHPDLCSLSSAQGRAFGPRRRAGPRQREPPPFLTYPWRANVAFSRTDGSQCGAQNERTTLGDRDENCSRNPESKFPFAGTMHR